MTNISIYVAHKEHKNNYTFYSGKPGRSTFEFELYIPGHHDTLWAHSYANELKF